MFESFFAFSILVLDLRPTLEIAMEYLVFCRLDRKAFKLIINRF